MRFESPEFRGPCVENGEMVINYFYPAGYIANDCIIDSWGCGVKSEVGFEKECVWSVKEAVRGTEFIILGPCPCKIFSFY